MSHPPIFIRKKNWTVYYFGGECGHVVRVTQSGKESKRNLRDVGFDEEAFRYLRSTWFMDSTNKIILAWLRNGRFTDNEEFGDFDTAKRVFYMPKKDLRRWVLMAKLDGGHGNT